MRLTYLPVFIAFWMPALTCYAEVSEYEFEIVIFEDVSKRYVDSEEWPRLEHQLLSEPPETTNVNVDDTKILEGADPAGNNVINITSNDTGMLNKYTRTINASARYNVLVHKAWQQAGLDAESAINVHINSKENPVSDAPATLTGFNSRLNNSNDKSSSSISGEIKIILGRYLHI